MKTKLTFLFLLLTICYVASAYATDGLIFEINSVEDMLFYESLHKYENYFADIQNLTNLLHQCKDERKKEDIKRHLSEGCNITVEAMSDITNCLFIGNDYKINNVKRIIKYIEDCPYNNIYQKFIKEILKTKTSAIINEYEKNSKKSTPEINELKQCFKKIIELEKNIDNKRNENLDSLDIKVYNARHSAFRLNIASSKLQSLVMILLNITSIVC